MNVLIKNLRPQTKLVAAWQAGRDGGFYIHSHTWTHIKSDGRESRGSWGLPQTFGYYVIRASLDGFKTDEHLFPVTEELTEIKISYRQIK